MLWSDCSFIHILHVSLTVAAEYENGVYSTLVIEVGMLIRGILKTQANILPT
jgi:hypothetical protein